MYVFNLVFIYIVFWLYWWLIPSYVTLFLCGILAETVVTMVKLYKGSQNFKFEFQIWSSQVLFFFIIDIDVCKFNHMRPWHQYENPMNLF